jgi:alpha-L-arabinofuranosidase
VIDDHWRIMGRFDADHRTKFVIDEWGNWYKAAPSSGRRTS